MRVFIGLTEISGYGANLSRGLTAIGVDAVFLDLSPNPYKYGQDTPENPLFRIYQLAARRRAATPRKKVASKVFWRSLETTLAPFALLWAALTCDAFVFLYGTTFTGLGELRLLKLLRRKILFVCVGSDIRPTYISGGELPGTDPRSIEECARRTGARKHLVQQIERWADVVISHPPFSQLQEKPFVKFLSIGIPREPREVTAPTPDQPRRLRLLHAPSNPSAKGTEVIRACVARVRLLGHDIEYIEVAGMPNDEVLAELATCDIVLDQLYGDTPMAGLAADAALFSKPTIVGGYGWDELVQGIPKDEFPPTHCCHPDEFTEAIIHLVEDEEYRAALGQRAREFVITRWSSKEVAGRILRLISGDIPTEWVYDPRAVRYVGGWGQSEAQSAGFISGVVARFGAAALQIADKPELELSVLSLAELADPSA